MSGGLKGHLKRIKKLEAVRAKGSKLLVWLDQREAELPAETDSHVEDLRFLHERLRKWATEGLIR